MSPTDVSQNFATRSYVGLRIAAAVLLSSTVIMASTAILFAAIYSSTGGKRDFVAYWVAAQQLVRGHNPYQPSDNPQLNLALGENSGQLPIMLYPPVIFWLVAPFGFIGIRVAAALWFLLLTACFIGSTWIIWDLNGRRNGELYLLGFCFAPGIYCLMSGQIGLFLLLGIALFLWLHKSHSFLAGAALVFCAFKPHLFIPFGLVLTLWVVQGRRYRILAGLATVLFAVTIFSFWLDPQGWLQWERMLHAEDVVGRHLPTLGGLLCSLVNPRLISLQYVPEAVGCVWSCWYFRTRRTYWDWLNHGLLILIVSVACAPYAWTTDEVLLLPALLVGVQRAKDYHRLLMPFVLILGTELFEVLWGAGMVGVTAPYYAWTVPAYLMWYLYANRGQARSMHVVPM